MGRRERGWGRREIIQTPLRSGLTRGNRGEDEKGIPSTRLVNRGDTRGDSRGLSEGGGVLEESSCSFVSVQITSDVSFYGEPRTSKVGGTEMG